MFGVKHALRRMKMEYSYLNSGVDIKKADELTSIIADVAGKKNIGSFAGLYEHKILDEYCFAACCDGIGTKIIPLIEKSYTKTIANDLFAMNINDLICCGAEPLFFLDYIAAYSLNKDVLSNFILELNKILKKHNCVLLGGETSELGNLILKKYFDVAGFLLGIVKKENIITKYNVDRGDIIIGLKSNGVHANGFSLIRKLYSDNMLDENYFIESLAPVRIYYDIVMKLNKNKLINSCANITGGGIFGNLKRAIPEDLMVELDYNKIPKIEIFEKIKTLVNEDEAFKTFNMGVGFCLVVSPSKVKKVLEISKDYKPFVFGEVV